MNNKQVRPSPSTDSKQGDSVMEIEKIPVKEVITVSNTIDEALVNQQLSKHLHALSKKIVVLDDDPTGVQTVHGVSVYTDWSVESLEEGFSENNTMFFILTNSRSFTSEETIKVHREIATNLLKVSKKLNRDFIIVSRGDSTLRGHYPLETEVLRETLEANSAIKVDGEILFPFFKEGGRFTLNNIHYVQEGEFLVPAGETEFAKDKTFGYNHSHLGSYIEEKTMGRFKADETVYISLESIRSFDIEGITAQLLEVDSFNKVVVNALEYTDVKVFTIALLKAMEQGKRFLFRTAASFTKVIGGVSDKGLLTKEDLIKKDDHHGGLVIVGSHVKKTTEQLKELKKCGFMEFVEFNQHLVLNPPELEKEVLRVIGLCEKYIAAGQTIAVYTRRDRLDLGAGNKEEELKIAVRISDAVTSTVKRLGIRPAYVVAKGGITSSDIGTKGLGVKRSVVAGQIKPGIPVWITGNESKFPGIPYIIFPGNVGTKTTLREVVEILNYK